MNQLAPVPLSTTADTVTLRREEWEAHLDRLEDIADNAAAAAETAKRERLGEEEYRRLCYTSTEVDQLLNGVSELTIWRVRSGITSSELAKAANVDAGLMAELEAGTALPDPAMRHRLARLLRVPVGHLS